MGVFYGMGVGTGDPELLTLKAVRVLAQLDVLVAPLTKEDTDSLAYNIVRKFVPSRTTVLFRVFPMVREQAILAATLETIAGEIEEYINQGKNVGFVTLGDPMFYSTYIYLLKNLQGRGITALTIPGINSFSAVSSRTGMSLAEKDEKIAIIPSVYDDGSLDEIMRLFDTVILMKAAGDCSPVVDKLEKAGMKDNAVFVSRLDLDQEIIEYNLDNLKGMKANYLSMIIAKKRG